jgi:hypothetical protein
MIAIEYDIVNNRIISRNVEVLANELPERTNPDYKYFVAYEPSVKPNYDQRYYDYKMVETPKNIAHPVYPLYNQWLIEHNLTKRSNDDIFLSIENARKVANATLIDYDLQAMAIAVIIKRQNNEVLTSEEIQIALDWVSISNKLIQNKQIEANKKAQVLNNQEPDIDAGWERKI